MQLSATRIMPCLWFDTQAEEAAKHYVSIFKNSKLGSVSRYGKEGKEIHGKDAGTVLTAEFEVEGRNSWRSMAARISNSPKRFR